jgi:hypothetical protein
MERLIRSPDEKVNCLLTLCGNHNFWPPTRTSEFRIWILALREHQNFWSPIRTSDFRSRIRESPNSIPTLPNSWETCRLSLENVSYWYKTTPLYIQEDYGRLSSHLFNRQTNQSTTFIPTLLPSSSTYMLFIPWSTTKDSVLGLPTDLGQPSDVLALTGSLPGKSFDDFFASLPEN